MPDTYTTRNYFAHGGHELVIGGKLTFLPGAEIEGAEGALAAPYATASAVSATFRTTHSKSSFVGSFTLKLMFML